MAFAASNGPLLTVPPHGMMIFYEYNCLSINWNYQNIFNVAKFKMIRNRIILTYCIVSIGLVTCIELNGLSHSGDMNCSQLYGFDTITMTR